MTFPPTPPRLYFRLRDPGATVFRVSTGGPASRLEMESIAVANVRTGEIKPMGGDIPADDLEAIKSWIGERQSGRHERDSHEIGALAEEINRAAQWVQTRASGTALTAHAESLLFALHDLRSVIVRRLADSTDKPQGEE